MNEEEMLIEAGFTVEQAQALLELFAKIPHTHSMDEVDGLEEALEEVGEEDGEEDE